MAVVAAAAAEEVEEEEVEEADEEEEKEEEAVEAVEADTSLSRPLVHHPGLFCPPPHPPPHPRMLALRGAAVFEVVRAELLTARGAAGAKAVAVLPAAVRHRRDCPSINGRLVGWQGRIQRHPVEGQLPQPAARLRNPHANPTDSNTWIAAIGCTSMWSVRGARGQ